MSGNETEAEKPEATRKKWSWKKRIGAGFLVLLALLAAGWAALDIYANSLLQRELDAITARGEPVRWEDLAGSPVPDEQNAAWLYKQAGEKYQAEIRPWLIDFSERLKEPRNEEGFYGITHGFCEGELRKKYPKEVKELLSHGEEILALCRRARDLPQADWGLAFTTSQIMNDFLPNLSPQRRVAELLSLAAYAAHDRKDDATAIECILDGVAQGRAIGKMPVLTGQLVAHTVDRLHHSQIEVIAPTLAVGEDGSNATREQVKGLIVELLDEQPIRDNMKTAFVGERCFSHALCEGLRQGDTIWAESEGVPVKEVPWWLRILNYPLRPVWTLNSVHAMRMDNAFAQGAEEASYPAAKAKFPIAPDPERLLGRITAFFCNVWYPSFDAAFVYYCRSIASRRMAAVALAIRLYEIDHGNRPADLSELVPDYLPAVPEDPFADDGRMISYLPVAEYPRLYSVGQDGRDDGGKYQYDYGDVNQYEPDVSFFLSGKPPKRVPEKSLPGEPPWPHPIAPSK